MKRIGHRILHFPLTKIIIGFFIVAGFAGATGAGLGKLLENALSNKDLSGLISAVISSAVGIACYWAIFKLYEKRKITEIGTQGIGRNLLTGIALGFTLMSLTILVIYLSGDYKIVALNAITHLLPAFAMAISSAILEEILFRGILFRIVEEKLGSYISLLISALIFGLLHLMNPNSSLLIGIGLAIQAGLLLGVLYMYSRNLWLPIAVHFAWNFTLGGIWGAPVSGVSLEKTLITSTFQGNELITGGSFGSEGSVQATLFCLIATTVFFVLCKKQNKIQKPFWAK